MNLDPDSYGRNVSLSQADGVDTYTVADPGTGEGFTVEFPAGTPIDQVYSTINAMAPG